jgi:hypothetical protein
MQRGKCVYVGQSKSNAGSRVLAHIADKNFDRIHFLPCDNDLDIIERHFISKLKPIYNRQRYASFKALSPDALHKVLKMGTFCGLRDNYPIPQPDKTIANTVHRAGLEPATF